MRLSLLSLIALIGILPSFCHAQRVSPDDRELMRRYAMCKCLSTLVPISAAWRDEGSGTGYFEISSYGYPAFDSISKFTKAYLSENKVNSKYDRPLVVMRCIDYFESPQLKEYIKQLDHFIYK